MNDRFRAVWTIKRRTDSCTATGVGAMQRLHIWGKVSTGTKEPPIRRNTSSIFFSLSLFTEKRWQVIFNFATFESEQTVFQERQDLCITLPLIRCQSRCYSPPPRGNVTPSSRSARRWRQQSTLAFAVKSLVSSFQAECGEAMGQFLERLANGLASTRRTTRKCMFKKHSRTTLWSHVRVVVRRERALEHDLNANLLLWLADDPEKHV